MRTPQKASLCDHLLQLAMWMLLYEHRNVTPDLKMDRSSVGYYRNQLWTYFNLALLQLLYDVTPPRTATTVGPNPIVVHYLTTYRLLCCY